MNENCYFSFPVQFIFLCEPKGDHNKLNKKGLANLMQSFGRDAIL